MRKVLVIGLMFGTLAAWNTGCTGGDDDDDDHGAPVSIAITPANPTVILGSSLQLTATGTFDDQSTEDLTATSTWTTNSSGVATVSASGLVATVSSGSAIITAEHDGVMGTTTVTVAPAGATFDATISGDWSGAHPGTAYDYYVRVIDTDSDAIVFCDSENVVAVFNIVAADVLIQGHSYIAQALVDLDDNGIANESPHKYESTAVVVSGNTNFPIAHGPANDAANPTWTGPACP